MILEEPKPDRWSQADFDYLDQGLGLRCPVCMMPTKLLTIRTEQFHDKVRRTKMCVRCGHRKYSYESWGDS